MARGAGAGFRSLWALPIPGSPEVSQGDVEILLTLVDYSFFCVLFQLQRTWGHLIQVKLMRSAFQCNRGRLDEKPVLLLLPTHLIPFSSIVVVVLAAAKEKCLI